MAEQHKKEVYIPYPFESFVYKAGGVRKKVSAFEHGLPRDGWESQPQEIRALADKKAKEELEKLIKEGWAQTPAKFLKEEAKPS